MSTVPVYINGREFQLACDDGQEELLVALSQEVDDRVRSLARSLPNANESMLLLLTALTLADELSDERRILRGAQSELARTQSRVDEAQAQEDQARLVEIEAAMAATLQDIAERIERIAEQLETS